MCAEEVRHALRNTDSAYFVCHHVQYKEGTLIQHFVTHVVPPLVCVHVHACYSIHISGENGVLNKHVSNILSFATL